MLRGGRKAQLLTKRGSPAPEEAMPGSGPALRPAALPGSGCSSAAAPLHLITNGAASAAASLLLQIFL